MEKNERNYVETSIEYNNIEKCWEVLAWKTEEPDEESTKVAIIDLKGELSWMDEEAENDSTVAKDLEYFFDGKLFSIKDGSRIQDELCKIFMNCGREYSEIWDVVNPEGITSYGYDKKEILEMLCFVVGMPDSDDYKVFGVDNEDLRAAAGWLVEDIACAVGEVFVIDLNS